MATKIGISGFGRIGRLALRAINQYHSGRLEVAAINDLTDTKTNAHLLKWDTNYGRYPGEVDATEDSIIADGKKIKTYNIKKMWGLGTPEDLNHYLENFDE